MLKAFENRLVTAGMTRLDRVASSWFYALFLAWTFLQMRDQWMQLFPGAYVFMYVNGISVILIGAGLTFAVEKHFWLERVTAMILSINSFSQLILQVLHSAAAGLEIPLSPLFTGMFFASFFGWRALGLSIRIARERDDRNSPLKNP